MPQNQAANNFQTTLAAAATSSQTTLDLASITGAPSYPYLLALTPAGGSVPFSPYEVVQVTSLSSGTTVNVTRAVEGTAAAWNSGDTASNDFTAGNFGSLLANNWPFDFRKYLVYNVNDLNATTGKSGSGNAGIGVGIADVYTGTTSASSAYAAVAGGAGTSPSTETSPNFTAAHGAALVLSLQVAGLPAASGDYAELLLHSASATTVSAGGIGLALNYGTGLTTNIVYNTGSGSTTQASSVAITDTNYHQVVFWCFNGTWYVYIDGALAATITGTTVGFWSTTNVAVYQVANGSSSTTNVRLTCRSAYVFEGVSA